MTGLEEAWLTLKLDKQKFEEYMKAATEKNASEESLTDKEKEMKAMKMIKELQRLVRVLPLFLDLQRCLRKKFHYQTAGLKAKMFLTTLVKDSPRITLQIEINNEAGFL